MRWSFNAPMKPIMILHYCTLQISNGVRCKIETCIFIVLLQYNK